MNQVGALIWEMLPQDGLNVEALCRAIHERFPDESFEQIRSDAEELLDELARNDLVSDIQPAALA